MASPEVLSVLRGICLWPEKIVSSHTPISANADRKVLLTNPVISLALRINHPDNY
jgi:hypothetical protein